MKKKTTRWLALLLAAAVVCMSVTMPVGREKNAYAAETSEDFAITNGVLTKYQGSGGDVVIPEGVTCIGDASFARCSNLTSVIIPPSVTEIALGAFMGCTGLKSVNIPSSVTRMGWDVFEGCSSLESVTIPSSVAAMGDRIFSNCPNLALYVEKGGNAVQYAIENNLKYRMFFSFDASENPVLSMDVMAGLLEQNVDADVIIKTGNGVSFTFEEGSMEAAEGVDAYDFTTTITREYDPEILPSTLLERDFVLKMDYKYSGKLPGKTSVRIPLGREYARKTVCYALLNADGTYGEQQELAVDAEGYITVTREEGASYVIYVKFLRGDADGEGNVTINDALAILKEVAKIQNVTFVKEAADCDGDGAVSINDAIMVLKHVAKIIDLGNLK